MATLANIIVLVILLAAVIVVCMLNIREIDRERK